MKTKKFASASLLLCLAAVLLTGCFCSDFRTDIQPDGSGTITMRVGYTKEFLEELNESLETDKKDPTEGQDSFTYDGKEYYGTVQTKEFSNIDELNKILSNPNGDAEISVPTDSMPNSTMTFSRGDDGSFTLIYRTAPTEETAGDAQLDLSEEEARELKSQAIVLFAFYMPGAVSQVSGPKDGVTIDGSKLTLDTVKMSDVTDGVWEFRSAPPATGNATAAPKKPVVVPTRQKLTVNGVEKSTEIYNIDGSNYFKLRDMASLLSDTGSRFSVDFDAAKNSIVVKKGGAYAAGELKLPDEATMLEKARTAVKSPQSIQIDGADADLTAYNIANTNYFSLRALGKALDFDVDYDEATATMVVTTR